MPSDWRSFARDALLRVLGLGLVSLAVFAMHHLYVMVHVPPAHEAPPAEMAVAVIGFLSASGGVTLAALGRHIFDRVEISQRWARYRNEDHPRP